MGKDLRCIKSAKWIPDWKNSGKDLHFLNGSEEILCVKGEKCCRECRGSRRGNEEIYAVWRRQESWRGKESVGGGNHWRYTVDIPSISTYFLYLLTWFASSCIFTWFSWISYLFSLYTFPFFVLKLPRIIFDRAAGCVLFGKGILWIQEISI